MSEKNEAVAEVEVVKVPARTFEQIANVAVAVMPVYKVRDTKSTTFRCLTLVEDEKINWKKGLVYLIARYSKGVNLEMWMYSTKGGAELAQFNDLIRPLAVGNIKSEALGKALKLRLQLADTMTDEEIETAIKGMMEAVEPTLQAIREKIVIAVSKKETKKAEKPAADGQLSKRQQKKAAKRAARSAVAAA